MSVVIPSLRAAVVVPGWAKSVLWRNARAVPSLDLRFADNKSLVDAVTGASLITFTRASSGTFVDSAGVLQTAATDEPRFGHNPTTGESLGLLVEEQRTNLLVRSEEFENSAWNSVAGARTVTANQIVAPDGTTTADLVTADGTTATHSVSQSLTLSAVPYAYSVFAKAGTNNFLQLRFFVAFGAGFANFDLATGVVGTVSGSVTSSIQAYPNGWYRCTMVFTPTAVTSSVGVYIVSSASASSAESNSLSTSVYLWGAQLEAGAFPSSYIPTTTAAATRSADVASITGSAFSGWYSQDEGTLFAECAVIGSTGVSQPIFHANAAGADTPRIMLIRRADGRVGFNAFSTITDADIDSGVSLPVFSFVKSAAVYKVNNFALTASGVTPVLDTSGNVPTVDRIGIGFRAGANTYLNGTIKRLTFWPQALPSQLRALTQ